MIYYIPITCSKFIFSYFKNQKPIKLTCQHCKHSADNFGNNEYIATCPHCFTKVSINKQKKKNSLYAEVTVENVMQGVNTHSPGYNRFIPC
jgi:hypothetical protein